MWQQEVEEMVSRGLGWKVIRLLSWAQQTGSQARSSFYVEGDYFACLLIVILLVVQVLFDTDGSVWSPSMLRDGKHLRTMMTRGGMLADEMVVFLATEIL